MSKKTYKIPVEWKSYGTNVIEAESLDEAMEISKYESLPIGDYLVDSDKYDWESIKEQYPDEWKNEKLIEEYREYVKQQPTEDGSKRLQRFPMINTVRCFRLPI